MVHFGNVGKSMKINPNLALEFFIFPEICEEIRSLYNRYTYLCFNPTATSFICQVYRSHDDELQAKLDVLHGPKFSYGGVSLLNKLGLAKSCKNEAMKWNLGDTGSLAK